MAVSAFDKQGHRGARGLMPENTIAAMLRAMDLGVNTLEMDVVISKDGKVVLSHDPYFSSLISTRPDGKYISPSEERSHLLYAMNYEEIRRWDVGMKLHPLFPKQMKIPAVKPLLEELIDSVEAYSKAHKLPAVQYNIETKTSPSGDGTLHPAPGEFVRLLMDVITKKGTASRTIIQSFDERTIRIVHNDYPSVSTAFLVERNRPGTIQQQLDELGFTPRIYSPEYRLVTPELLKFCHGKGIRVIPWTVNDAAEIKRLRELGVDGVITDYPDLFDR
jgi:glycerophosphoryl diester phosphodiesterase